MNNNQDYKLSPQFDKLLETVDYVYESTGEIKATAIELEMSPIKVKKLLITSGKLEYEETAQIQRLMQCGKKLIEIQQELGLKKSSINSYLPYSKVPYKDEVSVNAEHCDLYRRRKRAVEELKQKSSNTKLWQCIKLFEGYRFHLDDSKLFYYELVTDEEKSAPLGINVKCGKESISIKKSQINKVYKMVMEDAGKSDTDDSADLDEAKAHVKSGEKLLQAIPGGEYVIAMFKRFGIYA